MFGSLKKSIGQIFALTDPIVENLYVTMVKTIRNHEMAEQGLKQELAGERPKPTKKAFNKKRILKQVLTGERSKPNKKPLKRLNK